MSHEHRTSQTVPLIFGDVALIRYPDGDDVLGGQAFSIAWHLQGLGVPALLVTRIGDDDAGDDALRAMEQWELDTRGVQRASRSPTGTATVEPHPGTPRITAPPDQPWDGISADAALGAVRALGCAMIVHGARALRGASNRRVLDRLIDACLAPVYFDATNDVSLLDRAALERCLTRSKWVAVRGGELAVIAETLDLEAAEPRSLTERLRDAYGIDALFVLADVDGAYAVTGERRHQAVVPAGDLDIVDRVGVEEAFSAIAVYGLLADWPTSKILRRAQGFVELTAALPMPAIPTGAFYDDVRTQWAADSERGETAVANRGALRATQPISKQARLPAELEGAAQELEELRQRETSARMKAAAVSDEAAAGDAQSRAALARAQRSVDKLGERIGETERRLRGLKKTAESIRGEPALDDADVDSC